MNHVWAEPAISIMSGKTKPDPNKHTNKLRLQFANAKIEKNSSFALTIAEKKSFWVLWQHILAAKLFGTTFNRHLRCLIWNSCKKMFYIQ